MTYHIGDDPRALGSIIESLGGKIVSDDSFELPIAKLHDALPKLDGMGVVLRKINHRIAEVPGTGQKVHDVGEFKALKKDTEPPLLKSSVMNGIRT